MMNTNLQTRIHTLYDHIFNMYEKLLAIAHELIDLDSFQSSHLTHNPEYDPLATLFSDLSLPDDAARPKLPEATLGDPAQYAKDKLARIKRAFGALSTEVKRARETYKDLRTALAVPGMPLDTGIKNGQGKLTDIMDTVDILHNTIEESLEKYM